MNYALIAQGLRLIADGIDAAPEHQAPAPAPQPDTTPVSEPTPAPATAEAQADTQADTQPPEAMSYDAFTASLRTVAARMPPGTFNTIAGPMLQQLGIKGINELQPADYQRFLNEAARRVAQAVGGQQ
jgi:hypothetical protein